MHKRTPERTNLMRAQELVTVLQKYGDPDEDWRTNAIDFLADLMHLCKIESTVDNFSGPDLSFYSFDNLVESAKDHFTAEIYEEKHD